MDLWRLLAHRHWFTLRVFGLEFRLCSRCSGYLAGLLLLTASRSATGLQALPVQRQLIICVLLAMPLIIDWLTQSWGLREGGNATRFTTGAMMGMGVSLYSGTGLSPGLRGTLFASVALTVVLVGSIGLKTRRHRILNDAS